MDLNFELVQAFSEYFFDFSILLYFSGMPNLFAKGTYFLEFLTPFAKIGTYFDPWIPSVTYFDTKFFSFVHEVCTLCNKYVHALNLKSKLFSSFLESAFGIASIIILHLWDFLIYANSLRRMCAILYEKEHQGVRWRKWSYFPEIPRKTNKNSECICYHHESQFSNIILMFWILNRSEMNIYLDLLP